MHHRGVCASTKTCANFPVAPWEKGKEFLWLGTASDLGRCVLAGVQGGGGEKGGSTLGGRTAFLGAVEQWTHGEMDLEVMLDPSLGPCAAGSLRGRSFWLLLSA